MKTERGSNRLILLALAMPTLLTLVGVQLGCLFPASGSQTAIRTRRQEG